MNVGYARTTSDQTAGLTAQERDLKAAGAQRIFGEQISGTAKRTKLAESLTFLREGDVLSVAKTDRLARSTVRSASRGADQATEGRAGPGAIAKRLGIARSSVYRVLDNSAGDKKREF